MALLSLFFDALGLVRGDDALRRTADRLLDLAQLLQPGRERRAAIRAAKRAAPEAASRTARKRQ